MTNFYGLFLSSPVIAAGRFVGMVGVSLAVPRLGGAIKQLNALVTDDLGVIVLAQDPALLMRTMPGATVNTLSAVDRDKRYKRDSFAAADIGPAMKDATPSLYRWGG